MTENSSEFAFPTPIPGARIIARFLVFMAARYKVLHHENIPQDQQVIITFNHLHYMDVPAAAALFNKKTWPAGFSARKYKGTWLEPFFRIGSPIWVEQNSPDRKALMHATHLIKQGYNIGIAPEGHRSRTGQLQTGKEGAAFLATRNNLPILPIGIWGTERVFKHLRPLVTVKVGKPFRLPEGRARGPQLEAYTERLMCAIAALLPEQYHGVYHGNPLIEEMRPVVAPETV